MSKISKCTFASAQRPGTRASKFFFWLSFYVPVCLMCWLVSTTVSTPLLFRLTANLSLAAGTKAPSKSGTFPLAIATRHWPGTRASKFFPQVFPPSFCWFVYWLLTNTVSTRWCWVLMENKLPAAVATRPSRFGTRNLENASRPWPGTPTGTFFFFQIIFPQNWPATRTCAFFWWTRQENNKKKNLLLIWIPLSITTRKGNFLLINICSKMM